MFWEEAVGNVQHGETKFHFSFKAVLFPNSADQVAAWTGGKFSTYRAALQLRHFAALLSAETSGILGEKLFPSLYTSVAAFRLQARCPIMELTKAVCRDTMQGKLIFPQVCVCGAWPGN